VLKGYRAFLFQASLLNLTVAFILGAAFSTVVESLAEDVIMAPIAGFLGFEQVADWRLGGIAIGSFLAALLGFVAIATVLFVIVSAVGKLQGRDPGDAGVGGLRRDHPSPRDPRRAAQPAARLRRHRDWYEPFRPTTRSVLPNRDNAGCAGARPRLAARDYSVASGAELRGRVA